MISVEEYLKAYRDSVRSTPQSSHSRKLVKDYNKELLEKYPWLTPGYIGVIEPEEAYNYGDTWLDSLPGGWRIAFGDQMIEELDQLLKKYNIKDYTIYQIKEKWGALRWYDSGFSKEGYKEYNDWLCKYENLSERTCILCGKPAEYLTRGWIVPVCRSCAVEKNYTEDRLDPLDLSTEDTTNQEDV